MKAFNLKGFNYWFETKTFIETPLGNIKFDMRIDGEGLPTHSTSFSNGKGDYLTCWYSSLYDIELLICSPKLNLPEHLQVDGCRAAIWRVVLHEKEAACNFYAKWSDGFIWTSGGANSGEHLDAQTWENDKFEVSLGTQDGEMLQARVINNELMPAKLNSLVDPLALIRYMPNGLMVPLEQIFVDNICQIHFVVSWAHRKQDDVSTWFAVDLYHKDILDGYLN